MPQAAASSSSSSLSGGSPASSQRFGSARLAAQSLRGSVDSLLSQASSSSSQSTCGTSSLAWGVKYPFMESELATLLLHQDIPLFYGLTGDGKRPPHNASLSLYHEQVYIVVNDPRLLLSGKAHAFGPDGGLAFSIRASHGIHGGFVLSESFTNRELLLVTETQKRLTIKSRNAAATVVRKLSIRNLDMYDDVPRGDVLFSLDISKDDRSMDIIDPMSSHVLQIRGNLAESATIHRGESQQPIGEVGNLLGRFLEERSRFAFVLRDCSKEEAAVLLASSYAMFAHQNPDLKERILITKHHTSVGQTVKSRLSLDGPLRKSMDSSRARRMSISGSATRPFRRS